MIRASILPLVAALTIFGVASRGGADDQLIPDSVWYDAQDQTLKPVPVKPSIDDSPNRASRWLPRPEKVGSSTTTATPTPNGVGDTGIMRAFGWMVLSAAGITLIALIVYAIKNSEANLFQPLGAALRDDDTDLVRRERMKELPVELQDHSGDLRSQTEVLMSHGNFDRAIVCLYGHQLLLLDKHAWLRLSRGKTNHRYVREVRPKSQALSDLLELTVDAFEKSYFGRHDITSVEFDELWSANADLERAASHGSEAAA